MSVHLPSPWLRSNPAKVHASIHLTFTSFLHYCIFVPPCRAKLWIEFYSSAVTGNVFGLLRADSKAAVAEAKAKLVDGMKVAEACLLRQGNDQGGDYFLGGQFTIADIATVTFLQRSLVVLPAYRDVDMWAIMEEHNLGRLQRWAKAVLARPAAMETRPADDVMVKSWGKIVAAMKD